MESMDTHQLWYRPEENFFEDNNGQTVYNVYSIVSPNDVLLFKLYHQSTVVRGRDGLPVELFYPDDNN